MVEHQVCARLTPPWWANASELERAETLDAFAREFECLVLWRGELLVPLRGDSIHAAIQAEAAIRARAAEILALVGRRFDPKVVACSSAGCGSHYAGAADSPPPGWLRADGGEPFCCRACIDRWRDAS